MKFTNRFFSRVFFILFFLLAGVHIVNASHALPLIGLVGNAGPTGITVSASSDPNTCISLSATPYWMQIEVTCNPSGFTGNPPASNSPAWGTAPWYHSVLNIPGYTAPYTDNCVLEPYVDILIPYSQLCPGTTYYWRAREFCEPTNSIAPWMGPFSFVTPGLPPSSILSTTSSAYDVCPGDIVQLDATISGGCPGATFTYSWAPTTGLSDPTIANPIATITSAINYTVTVSGGCFTITSNDDTVQISLAPTVVPGTATSTPSSICSGQSSWIVLSGMGSNSIQWQVSPNGVTWFNVPGGTNDSLNTGSLSSSLYYQATVTGSGWPGTGCGTATSNAVMITVNPAPTSKCWSKSNRLFGCLCKSCWHRWCNL